MPTQRSVESPERLLSAREAALWLQGYILWAFLVDPETGLTVEDTPADPWGDVWHVPITNTSR
jgi:hypothetical protein